MTSVFLRKVFEMILNIDDIIVQLYKTVSCEVSKETPINVMEYRDESKRLNDSQPYRMIVHDNEGELF